MKKVKMNGHSFFDKEDLIYDGCMSWEDDYCTETQTIVRYRHKDRGWDSHLVHVDRTNYWDDELGDWEDDFDLEDDE